MSFLVDSLTTLITNRTFSVSTMLLGEGATMFCSFKICNGTESDPGEVPAYLK